MAAEWRRAMTRKPPAVVSTRTEVRDGVTYTVTVLEDGVRKTPAKKFGARPEDRKRGAMQRAARLHRRKKRKTRRKA